MKHSSREWAEMLVKAFEEIEKGRLEDGGRWTCKKRAEAWDWFAEGFYCCLSAGLYRDDDEIGLTEPDRARYWGIRTPPAPEDTP